MRVLCLGAALFATGCLSGDSSGLPECSTEVSAPKVFGGTTEPRAISLPANEILAIGSFESCTGTLIAPTWVITAKHCELTARHAFCIGELPDAPEICTSIRNVVKHPDADVALVELVADPSERVPDLTPVSLIEEITDCEMLGQTVEAAGYGETESNEYGIRLFTAEPLIRLSQRHLTIDGEGLRGLCRGDSGGPVFVTGADGAGRLAGTLSRGDVSCRGRDDFARLDAVIDWIAEITLLDVSLED